MKQIKTRLTHGEGIALDEFKSFFFFLNNLEDFTIAVHYYSLANEWILIVQSNSHHIRPALIYNLVDLSKISKWIVCDVHQTVKLYPQKQAIGIDEFIRAVRISTGETLSRNLVKGRF